MPEWGWVIAVFVGASLAYWAGVAFGLADRAPSENAWINVRTHAADAKKEVSLHGIDMEHEEQMALIARGVFDPVLEKVGYPEEEEDDDDD